METTACVEKRRTIRKFLPKPVPKETIAEIISEALWAPSWGNTQPWEFMVVSGPLMDKFKTENRNALMSGANSKPDIQMPEKWPDAMKSRYKDVGRTLFNSLSIGRDDVEARMNYYGEMFHIFDAPAMLLILLDKSLLLEYALLDVGLFLQTFMLLACDRGLGTATLAASVHFPQVAREVLPIPEDKHLSIGAAIGWPDPEAEVNLFERKRAPLEELITWVS